MVDVRAIRSVLLVLLVMLTSGTLAAAGEITVHFEVNDAQVKNQVLPGVHVELRPVGSSAIAAVGSTGGDGRWSALVEPGSYRISYLLDAYVPYTSTATELRDDGQLVTVSLSRMLEDTGEAARQIRIILNWGSDPEQVRDVDSHLACPCQDPPGHVYFSSKVHEGDAHRVELDVDDVDWGGPETITLHAPPPGRYLYWVHDYSAGPGTLGSSDVVVRVVIGDHEAGEFKVFKGVNQRVWRPFHAIVVGADGQATVLPFTEDEIAEGRDLEVDPQLQAPQPPATATPTTADLEASSARTRWTVIVAALLTVLGIAALSVFRRRF